MRDVEVLVIVHCDQDPVVDEKELNRIKSELSLISGVKDTYLAPRVRNVDVEQADIIATAFWADSDIPSKQSRVAAIAGVKRVEVKLLASA